MLLAYYVFIRYNSLKVVLSKEILAVFMGVIMLSVFVWITELLRMSQGPASLPSYVIVRVILLSFVQYLHIP